MAGGLLKTKRFGDEYTLPEEAFDSHDKFLEAVDEAKKNGSFVDLIDQTEGGAGAKPDQHLTLNDGSYTDLSEKTPAERQAAVDMAKDRGVLSSAAYSGEVDPTVKAAREAWDKKPVLDKVASTVRAGINRLGMDESKKPDLEMTLQKENIPYLKLKDGRIVTRPDSMSDSEWEAQKKAQDWSFDSGKAERTGTEEPTGRGGGFLRSVGKFIDDAAKGATPAEAGKAAAEKLDPGVGNGAYDFKPNQTAPEPSQGASDLGENIVQTGKDVLGSIGKIGASTGIAPGLGVVDALSGQNVRPVLKEIGSALNPIPSTLLGMQALGHAVMPGTIPAPDISHLGDSAPPAGAPPAGAPPAALPSPQMGPMAGGYGGFTGAAPQGGPTSVRASVSTRGGGPAPAQEMNPYIKALKGLEADHAAAVNTSANIEANAAEAQAKVFNEGLLKQAEAQDFEMRTTQRVQQESQQRMEAYQKTLAEAADPAKIDPDHFWKVRDTGQKVAAVLAAFFTGGESIASIHAAINRDVAAQQADVSNKQGALREKLQGQANIYMMGRQNGLDAIQAAAVAKDTAYKNVEQQSKAVLMSSASPLIKAKAQEALVESQKGSLMAQATMDHQDKLLQNERWKTALQARHIAFSERLQALKAAGGPKLQEVKGPTAMEIGKLDAMQRTVEEARERFGLKGSLARGFDKLLAIIPNTDAANYNTLAGLMIQEIGPMMGSGVLSESETERWRNLIAQAGDLGGEAKLKLLSQLIANKRASQVGALRGTNFDVSGLGGGGASGWGGDTEGPTEDAAESGLEE